MSWPSLHELPTVFGITPIDVQKWPSQRDLDVVELWSGKGTVAKAGQALDLSVATFDILNRPEENITSLSGFRLALDLVLRLRPGGLLHMAPVCSSFGFMNSSRCQRDESNDYTGDWSYLKVHEGNVMADIAAFFLLVGWARQVQCSLENPMGSTIFKYGCVAPAIDKLQLQDVLAYRCAYDEEAAVGDRYLKGFKFFATGPWIQAIRKPCECDPKCHNPTVTRLRDSSQGVEAVAVRGIADNLVESGSYPPALGRAIVDAWKAQSKAKAKGKAKAKQDEPGSSSKAKAKAKSAKKPLIRPVSSSDDEQGKKAKRKPNKQAEKPKAKARTRGWMTADSDSN